MRCKISVKILKKIKILLELKIAINIYLSFFLMKTMYKIQCNSIFFNSLLFLFFGPSFLIKIRDWRIFYFYYVNTFPEDKLMQQDDLQTNMFPYTFLLIILIGHRVIINKVII
ncbi:hypothetical protein CG473_01710 [Mycoplasma testudineum]|nr:hypothetical protein CG473_01710 [Mycoplasma testudineum]